MGRNLGAERLGQFNPFRTKFVGDTLEKAKMPKKGRNIETKTDRGNQTGINMA